MWWDHTDDYYLKCTKKAGLILPCLSLNITTMNRGLVLELSLTWSRFLLFFLNYVNNFFKYANEQTISSICFILNRGLPQDTEQTSKTEPIHIGLYALVWSGACSLVVVWCTLYTFSLICLFHHIYVLHNIFQQIPAHMRLLKMIR